jgi:hypothetical protein
MFFELVINVLNILIWPWLTTRRLVMLTLLGAVCLAIAASVYRGVEADATWSSFGG